MKRTVVNLLRKFALYADNIDRRVVYLMVAVSLSIPLVLNVRLHPAEMATASAFYEAVKTLEPQDNRMVLISLDWGPGTQAENRPQSLVVIEHLMRKRIPFAVTSIYALAAPFLRELPLEVKTRLEQEMPGEKWEYGTDWINLGFRPGGIVTIQSIAKTNNLKELLKTDANNTPLEELPLMKNINTSKDIALLAEFTGLLGVFNTWLQYLPGPRFVHGCTSVTIPEAFIYYSSKQIVGLFEGVAGAAWYETLLAKDYPERSKETYALHINTGLSFAQILVIALVLLGNAGFLLSQLGNIPGGRADGR